MSQAATAAVPVEAEQISLASSSRAVWCRSRARAAAVLASRASGEPRVFRTVRYWPISGGELAVQVLVVDLVWGLVGECRVESFRIVSEFDVSRNVVDGVSAGRILGTMDPLVLQDGEE